VHRLRRIREYSTSLKDIMSLEDCLSAAQECNAPMISICGGEPLIYRRCKRRPCAESFYQRFDMRIDHGSPPQMEIIAHCT